MPAKNRFGLSRTIPEPVKRLIRQRCGFGCVICGASIIDYEHVDPPFEDAREHSPDHIVLLCPGHHAEVTRGFMAKQTVKDAAERPRGKQDGFSFGNLDPAKTHPYIIFAGVTLRNCPVPVQVMGEPLFLIETPEFEGGPYRLSAKFFNQHGQLSLQIHRNEWRTSAEHWDVETSGGRIVIRTEQRVISLDLQFIPREGIKVNRIDMRFGPYRIIGNGDDLDISANGNPPNRLTGCIADNCNVGLSIG